MDEVDEKFIAALKAHPFAGLCGMVAAFVVVKVVMLAGWCNRNRIAAAAIAVVAGLIVSTLTYHKPTPDEQRKTYWTCIRERSASHDDWATVSKECAVLRPKQAQ
jgi:hypothetical protein